MDSSQNEEIFVTKLYVNSNPLYVKVLWVDDNSDLFHIKLFFEDNSWTGKYTKESAVKRSERLYETEEDYYSNVKKCLNGTNKDYVHDFTICSDDINFANFTWKKRYEGALKTYGAVLLQRDEVAAPKETLVDYLLEQNKKLISDIEVANKKNEDLKVDLEAYSQRFKDIITSKTDMEETLYAQFVKVLNEKKKRIQLLKEHLKNYEQTD